MRAAPLYLQNLPTPLPFGRGGLRSEYQVKWLVVPFINKRTFARCSFSVNGLFLWNAQRAIDDIHQFKTELDTHLFNKF